jgi:phosphoserine phosphatase RsbU/P
MANLQAHLRSQSSATPRDPSRVVREVNRLLFASTATEHYATLFFGVYEDARRCLRYVNCGHNPPVLLRANGAVERLTPTAPVVGLFEQWTCSVGEVTLAPGDVLAIFSDGVTEAPARDIEFGEERLVDLLRSVRDLDPPAIVDAILAAVQEYGGEIQYDDLTLLVARALG